MTAVEWLGTLSTWLVAAATVVLVLAFMVYVAQWAAVSTAMKTPAAADAPIVAAADSPSGQTAAGIGLSFTWLATFLLLLGVLARATSAGRVPWGNMYEFGCVGALAALVAYLALVRQWSIDWIGPIITGFAAIVLGSSMLFVYVPPGPLVPALDSYWLVIHVLAATVAGAAFLIGASASALFLIQQRSERRGSPTPGVLRLLPPSTEIDQIAFKVHAFAFPIWTFAALIAGPIWAQYAWGRYWGWDPKEVWAFITWVVYAGYLHARATGGWHGRRAAIVALVGFATFLFNFVGVNLWIPGLHSYAK